MARTSITRLLAISKCRPTTSITPCIPSPYSHAARSPPHAPTRFTSSGAAGSGKSREAPLGKVSTYGSWALTEMASAFPGMDYEHWFVHMDNPGGKGASKEEIIDCYVKTLAQVVGSEEEARKKIYKVICDPKKCRLGFGCELDWETAYKLEELPGVGCISADCYRDPENKDYGGELFVNGEIVQRSPERERRAYAFPRPRLESYETSESDNDDTSDSE